MEEGEGRFFNEIVWEEKKKIPPANWKKYQKEMNRIYEALQEAKSIEEYYGILKIWQNRIEWQKAENWYKQPECPIHQIKK